MQAIDLLNFTMQGRFLARRATAHIAIFRHCFLEVHEPSQAYLPDPELSTDMSYASNFRRR
jgi:hypothetical protein